MNENDLGDIVVLQPATCYELYKNRLPPETVDLVRNLRNQIAQAQAHNENMMNLAGRRDQFLRNDDGPFFGRGRHRMMMGRAGRIHREGRGLVIEVNMPPLDEAERNVDFQRQRALEMFEMFEHEPIDIHALLDAVDNSSDSGKIHRITCDHIQ